ncbi:MAG TPA: PDDEXK nuclease domain-containing protein [Polyangia bacterium]|jgi:predicted nuclease of restriction endonuclease-like (RecB) superfamily|nr:PDDEXK nuclease domain-containing protein [Polyangia bacterium]
MLADVVRLVDEARRYAARSANAAMTATYWLMGRRMIEHEQSGTVRAGYGEELLQRLSHDLTRRLGRGFSVRNLEQMRRFYLAWPNPQTASANSAPKGPKSTSRKSQTASAKSSATASVGAAPRFPLPWSHYVKLLSVEDPDARTFYEAEALRGGWSVRQLDRQISTRFYERALLSKNKAALLTKGSIARTGEEVRVEDEIKDPFVLEFLGLKDEYSESDLESVLVEKIESFLLELGGDFSFIGRQRRLRVGDEWYRVDLLFFHRRLRCLVVIDLKLGKFTHADAGQMHLYLNYAREHWVLPDENPPIGLILCTERDATVARYALEGLPNKVLAAEYRMALPDEKMLAEELRRTRRLLEGGAA